MTRTRERMHDGKRPYPKKRAKQWAKKRGRRFEAYKCLFCDAWHIGHYRRAAA